jgi:glycosyltransferase involved in cell wall biosynthesis
VAGGAASHRLAVIPNGISCPPNDTSRAGPHRPPVVALIGRVVPIKDVKTFLAACALLRRTIPQARALVLGPTNEDPDYFEQCRTMAAHLGIQDMVEFPGQVRLDDYFHKIDLLVLTSISEAQPLVILEAAAQGIPAVATRVGACPEMILGAPDEDPLLGPAGLVTPLANPAATAEAMARILTDAAFYARASRAARRRVERFYNKPALDAAYAALYAELREAA